MRQRASTLRSWTLGKAFLSSRTVASSTGSCTRHDREALACSSVVESIDDRRQSCATVVSTCRCNKDPTCSATSTRLRPCPARRFAMDLPMPAPASHDILLTIVFLAS